MKENIAPERETLAGIEKELARGLQFANLLGSINQEKGFELNVLLQSLVDLLISKGIIHYHELEERKKRVGESLSKAQAETPHVQLVDAPDKYAAGQEVLVDCASRLAVCRGVCCKLWFSLSVQDLSEGLVRWNYGMPYGIAQEKDGFCAHFDPSDARCTVYEHRPLVCRSYDCRTDRRIWLNYDTLELSPEALETLQAAQAEKARPAGGER